MMGLDDFGLSVLAGWLANRIDFLKPKRGTTDEQTQESVSKASEDPLEHAQSTPLGSSRRLMHGATWIIC